MHLDEGEEQLVVELSEEEGWGGWIEIVRGFLGKV